MIGWFIPGSLKNGSLIFLREPAALLLPDEADYFIGGLPSRMACGNSTRAEVTSHMNSGFLPLNKGGKGRPEAGPSNTKVCSLTRLVR